MYQCVNVSLYQAAGWFKTEVPLCTEAPQDHWIRIVTITQIDVSDWNSDLVTTSKQATSQPTMGDNTYY